MLTLNDGRAELWQWDTGRTLSVDADCSQVHFSNKVFGRSIDVDVIDGVAIIPDILLQTDKELTAWAFVGTPENGYTKISKTFKVNKRNKPADYVFTPPDQTSLEEIKKEIEYLKSVQDPDAIKNAVEDYLEQNPVEVPVQSVNGQTGEVKLTAKDVGAISQDDLQEATNEALAQAKASGEFDGKNGQDGRPGVTPEISIGTVETLEAESEATASITGTPEKPVLNLGIPRGPAGEGSAIAVSGASVGQTVKIAAVDTNGVPTAWEAVDLVGGGGELPILYAATLEEATTEIKIDKDASGNPLSLSEWDIIVHVPGTFADYAAQCYIYAVNGDSKGFFATFVPNDSSALNVMRHRTVFDNFVESVYSKYQEDGGYSFLRYYENGVVSNLILITTYDSNKPFPVGTYVEVRGK